MNKQRVGEYVTFFLSLLIVLGLAVVLVKNIGKHDSEIIGLKSRVLWKDIAQTENQFIVPVEVINEGNKTVNKIIMDVNSGNQQFEVELEYLGGNSKKKVFLNLKERPVEGSLTVKPLYYLLD